MARLKSTRRPSSLKETDYDHEIFLLDHTTTRSSLLPARTRSQSVSDSEQRRDPDSLAPAPENYDSRRKSDDQLRRKNTRASAILRDELIRRKYGKYSTFEDQQQNDAVDKQPVATVAPITGPAIVENGETSPDRPTTSESQKSQIKMRTERESAVDILYENQRGGFLCGMPFFSSSALGASDSPPWTNAAFKASATNPTNAQVPDPSWEWAWKEWSVNHQETVDDEGWEYSFMYAKCCSWHGPTWWNSFVRRRAWIRKRVKKKATRIMESHRLNSDYFTIHPTRSISPSKDPSVVGSRISVSREPETAPEIEEISDIGALMTALKVSRIDREKTEAIENFIKNGGDDLIYLSKRMHDIMGQFIFQASRRSLLTHLTKLYESESEALLLQTSQTSPNDETADRLPDGLLHVSIEGQPKVEDKSAAAKRRLVNIENSYHAADAAVMSLEYWSDIKTMATAGELKGAVDEERGWGEEWTGVDHSAAPKDVITDPIFGKDGDGGLAPDQFKKEVSWDYGGEEKETSLDKGKGKEMI